MKYIKNSNINENTGNMSKIYEKNKNSEIKNNEPGNPKKTIIFIKLNKNNFGHKKFIADISKISLVLNLLAIESIIKKELVDNIA
jgi:uncharacterized membrane protein